MKTLITFSLLALVLTTSCTITKRVHKKGFSVQWNGHYGQQPKNVLHHDEVAETPSANETEEIRNEFSSQENDETVNSENQIDGTSVEAENTSEEQRNEQSKNFESNQFKSFKTIKTGYKAISNKAITHLKTPIHKANDEDPKDGNASGKKLAKLSLIFGCISLGLLILSYPIFIILRKLSIVVPFLFRILIYLIVITAILAIVFSKISKNLGPTDTKSETQRAVGKTSGKAVLLIVIAVLLTIAIIVLAFLWWLTH